MNNTKSQKNKLKMTKELYQRHFPQNKKVDYRKLQMSNVSLYSMDDPIFISNVVDLIKSYFHGNKKITITDGTAHVGGASLNFSKYFDKVNSVEIDNFHCNMLKNNINEYNLTNKINVYCEDYLHLCTFKTPN
jgi:tRNA/tmRNA/rRNA uracil-C5-methylase (TrmA/RlmC/RlmD family)